MLGAYPIRQNLTYNDKAIDTSEWVGRYMTATHFNETEAAFGDITIENINSNSLINIKRFICSHFRHFRILYQILRACCYKS